MNVEKNETLALPMVSLFKIEQVVADQFQMKIAELRAKTRKRAVVIPRHIAMYLMRQQKNSSEAIARRFDCDSSTVKHAYKRVQVYRATDAKIREAFTQIIARLDQPFQPTLPRIKKDQGQEIYPPWIREVEADLRKSGSVDWSKKRVQAVVAAYFMVPSKSISQPAREEYEVYCRSIYNFIARFLDTCGNERCVATLIRKFYLRVDLVTDPLKRRDLSEIWDILLNRKQFLV